jgi:hypothetical protein
MTRTLLLLASAITAAGAAGCGPGQAQSPTTPLPPIQGKATPTAVASGDAGAMKALPRP